MIEADGDVEILDKTVYIATVSEGGKLDMEMRLNAPGLCGCGQEF